MIAEEVEILEKAILDEIDRMVSNIGRFYRSEYDPTARMIYKLPLNRYGVVIVFLEGEQLVVHVPTQHRNVNNVWRFHISQPYSMERTGIFITNLLNGNVEIDVELWQR